VGLHERVPLLAYISKQVEHDICVISLSRSIGVTFWLIMGVQEVPAHKTLSDVSENAEMKNLTERRGEEAWAQEF
jgi:hypothetical protein